MRIQFLSDGSLFVLIIITNKVATNKINKKITNCAVPLCNSYGDIFDNSRKRNLTYHKIPNAPELKKLWFQQKRTEEKSEFKVCNRFLKKYATVHTFYFD